MALLFGEYGSPHMGARHRWKALPQHRLLTTSTACGTRPTGNSTASRGPQQDGLALDKNLLVRANNRWSEPTMIDPVSRTFCQCKVCQSHKCWAPSAFFRRGCTQQASGIQCCTICTERRSHTQQHSHTGTTWCTALVPHLQDTSYHSKCRMYGNDNRATPAGQQDTLLQQQGDPLCEEKL
jgi:hypothetical protein